MAATDSSNPALRTTIAGSAAAPGDSDLPFSIRLLEKADLNRPVEELYVKARKIVFDLFGHHLPDDRVREVLPSDQEDRLGNFLRTVLDARARFQPTRLEIANTILEVLDTGAKIPTEEDRTSIAANEVYGLLSGWYGQRNSSLEAVLDSGSRYVALECQRWDGVALGELERSSTGMSELRVFNANEYSLLQTIKELREYHESAKQIGEQVIEARSLDELNTAVLARFDLVRRIAASNRLPFDSRDGPDYRRDDINSRGVFRDIELVYQLRAVQLKREEDAVGQAAQSSRFYRGVAGFALAGFVAAQVLVNGPRIVEYVRSHLSQSGQSQTPGEDR